MLRFLAASAFMLSQVASIDFKASCSTNETCVSLYNSRYSCVNNNCEHEPISVKRPAELIGLIAVIIISALSNAGGIGGGAMIIPILLHNFSFKIVNAVPLSKVTILSGAVINILMIINKRHSNDQNKLLIDYKLACFIVPLILAGTMIGVMMTKALPPIFIFVTLVIYLVKTTRDTFKKAKSLYVTENEDKIKKIRAQYDSHNNISITSGTTDGSQLEGSAIVNEPSKIEEVRNSMVSLMSPYKVHIAIALASYLLVVLSGLLRGGKGTSSIIGIPECSLSSWIIFICAQILCFKASRLVYNREKLAVINASLFTGNTLTLMRKLTFKSYIAGILAGTLGIGGGIVINPVLISLNVEPQIAIAISSLVVLFTSMSTTAQFIIAGAFELDIAFYFIVTSAVGSVLGNMIINKLLAIYKRQSLIVFILCALFFASGVTLSIIGVVEIRDQQHVLFFNSPC